MGHERTTKRQWNRQERDALLGMGEDSPEYTKGVLSILGLYREWQEWYFALQDYKAARERLAEVWRGLDGPAPNPITLMQPPTAQELKAMKEVGLASTALDAAWKPIGALVDEAVAQRDSGEFW